MGLKQRSDPVRLAVGALGLSVAGWVGSVQVVAVALCAAAAPAPSVGAWPEIQNPRSGHGPPEASVSVGMAGRRGGRCPLLHGWGSSGIPLQRPKIGVACLVGEPNIIVSIALAIWAALWRPLPRESLPIDLRTAGAFQVWHMSCRRRLTHLALGGVPVALQARKVIADFDLGLPERTP
jgi:hypothetical protein